MEDRHIVVEDFNAFMGLEGMPPQAMFGVYDGHGGLEAAEHVGSQLPSAIAANAAFKSDLVAAVKGGIEEVDQTFLAKAEREALTCGATVVTCFIRGDKLCTAWLGDSQAMLCRAGNAVELMVPHKPERPDEKKRIEDAGGVVVMYGTWRVQG
jgi:protein phosphatase 1E